MRRDIASKISDLMIEYGAKLDGSIKLVQDSSTEAEFLEYRRAVGKIMGYMLTDVMNPIYSQFPDLKPREFH